MQNLQQASAPHSIEAERYVLGGLMLDPEAWERISGKVVISDFFVDKHQLIFSKIESLYQAQKPFDTLMLAEFLKSHDVLDKAGGEAYLLSLASETPSTAHIEAYADLIRERSICRQIADVCQQGAKLAYRMGDNSSNDLLSDVESKIFAIGDQTSSVKGPEPVQQVLARTTAKIDELHASGGTFTGLETGFRDLDKLVLGLEAGDLVIVAGRPSMGKTLFAMNLVEQVAISKKKPALIFSLEMSAESLVMRMLSSLGRIHQSKVRSGQLEEDDWPRLTSAVSIVSQAPIFIDDIASLSPTELRARVRRMTRRHGQLGIVVVDYLQLMHMPGARESRTIEVSEISRTLKCVAKEMGVPIIVLSQLNRSLEQRQDKRPVMSDLRESGAIEQDADIISFIYRDEVYNEDSPDKGSAEIIIAKQRNGPIGKVKLTFLGQFCRFENFSSIEDASMAMME